MLFTSTILVLNCQILNTKIIINNVTAAKEREKMWNLSTINEKVQILVVFSNPKSALPSLDKHKDVQIDIQPYFKFDFCEKIAHFVLK